MNRRESMLTIRDRVTHCQHRTQPLTVPDTVDLTLHTRIGRIGQRPAGHPADEFVGRNHLNPTVAKPIDRAPRAGTFKRSSSRSARSKDAGFG